MGGGCHARRVSDETTENRPSWTEPDDGDPRDAWQRWADAGGVELDDDCLLDDHELATPDSLGVVIVGDGPALFMASRSASGFAVEAALAHAARIVVRFREHGAEPDGWQLRSDGLWQLWIRPIVLPPLD